MKIELDRSEFTVKVARMYHADQMIEWNVAAFDRSNFDVEFDMFAYNNQYWAQLSESQQKYVFDMYERMHKILSTQMHRESRILELINTIEEFYDFHSLESIESWIKLHSDIQFPSWLHSSYETMVDNHGSRKQTYLRDDYIKLICLAFALRMMIPVWSEFIGRTKDETNTALKEYRAYQLLSKSSLFVSEAMEKLRVYVGCIVPAEKQKSAIIDGMSSEEFPIWLLSVALIRKVCISDIRGIFPPPSRSSTGAIIEPPTLVTYVFNHVKERIKHSGNNFSGIVTNKEGDKGTNDTTDQQMSKFEGYKIKQEVSPGDVVLLEISVEDPYVCATQLEPNIPLGLVSECIENRLSKNMSIHDPQFHLMQWIFKPIISPRGMLYLNRSLIQQCLAVTEAVLWHRGHKFYSALMSATLINYEEGVSSIGMGSDARIPKEINEEILKYFPYMRKNTASKSKTVRTMNQAFVAIDSISALFSKGEWALTIPDERLVEITNSTRIRKMMLPHDAKIKLAELVLDLAKRGQSDYQRYLLATA